MHWINNASGWKKLLTLITNNFEYVILENAGREISHNFSSVIVKIKKTANLDSTIIMDEIICIEKPEWD